MAKKSSTPNVSTNTVKAPKPKPAKPKALEVNSPSVSSEVNGTVATSKMKGSYLTFDSRMDEDKPITVAFYTKESPGPVFEDIVYPSAEPGAGKTEIPLHYMTAAMGYTLVMTYTGTVNGQAAASLDKEVLMEFYPASEGKEFAPYFLHEKIFQNTPTFDMHDFKGDGIVKTKVSYLAQEGDKFYCTLVTQQFSGNPVFYTVAYGYALTAGDIAAGELTHAVRRGWLARQVPLYESMTLQCAYITSGLAPQPPADVTNPDEKTLLPRNALQIQHRRTAAFIGDQGLDLLPAHLRQSTPFNGKWCLNPELTKQGGNVDTPGLDTYAGDQIWFYVSGPGYGSKPIGSVTIANEGDLATIELSPCVIACFFNKPMTLTYTVQFPNSNGSQQSPERVINVSRPQFLRAEIEEATGDTLELNTFPKDATAFVPVWDYGQCAKCCWMWMTGKREDDSVYRFDILMDAPVTDAWKANGVDVPILRAELKKLADCSEFELHFAASFCDKCDFASAHEFLVQTFNIEQEDLVLDAPDVLEAVGKQLTIYNARNGMTVRVAYTGISDKHHIELNVKRADGTSIPLLPLPGDSNRGYVDFPIDRTEVIHASGKTLTINYTVTSACKIQTSKDLDLDVSEPVRLTTPEVAQATPPATQGGILDLRTFGADADIAVPDWWFMLTGQRGWLECSGKLWNGVIHTFKVMDAELITNADVINGLSRALKRLELDKYETGTELTFVFKLTADGGVDVNKAITFPALKLILRKRLLDETPFDPNGRDWNSWQRGAGATNPADLRRDYGPYPWGNGYWLANWGYTDTTNPGTQSEILFRVFNNLEPGRLYRFHAWVRDDNGVPNPPLLVLRVNGADITPVITPDTTWYLLEGAFTPSSTTVRLSLNNLRMGSGPGNDFRVTWLRVYEV